MGSFLLWTVTENMQQRGLSERLQRKSEAARDCREKGAQGSYTTKWCINIWAGAVHCGSNPKQHTHGSEICTLE